MGENELVIQPLYSSIFVIGKISTVPILDTCSLYKDNKCYAVTIQFPNNYKAIINLSIQQIYNYDKYMQIFNNFII